MPIELVKASAAPVDTIGHLVTEGWSLYNRIEADTKRLEDIKEILKKSCSAGKYLGSDGGEALVIVPGSKIITPIGEDKIEELRTTIGDDSFKTLFCRIVTWRPAKAAREIAHKILTPARLRKFLQLCEAECHAQVRFG